MELGLKDKVFLVTAASKGLGAAVAEQIAAEGGHVVLCSRSKERIEMFAARLQDSYGISAVGIEADLGKAEHIEKFVQSALQKFGRIDGVVCNAGGPKGGDFLSISDEDWQLAFENNVLSVVRLIRSCFPALRQSGGKVLTIASTSVKVPIPALILSNTLRSGIAGLMKSLSLEFAPYGILLNTICPGRIATDRTVELDVMKAQNEKRTVEDVEQERKREIPLGRYGDPAEFAALAAFLLSERNTYMTGSVFYVDGGMVKSL